MVNHAYIHIPFCIRKCKYCSFVSGENIKEKEQYLISLQKEISKRYKGEKLKTLYFGGGTPSLLEPKEIEKIISMFNFQQNVEITLEANPETITRGKMKEFSLCGINRVSLGVQSFNDEILKLIGRKHSEEDVFQAVRMIKESGISNISIDLIYGLPHQDISIFNSDIEKALSLDIQHISSYGLKIEEGSYFYENPPENLPNDEEQAEMFLYLCKKLEENDFIHYEISNFSKENFESNHNTAYWRNKHYYGFGLNASGYENNIRYRNTSDLKTYVSNSLKFEEEVELSYKEIMEEEIFLALRLNKGVNIDEFNKKYQVDFINKYEKIIKKYKRQGLMEIKNNHCCLTKNGILLSNIIMSEFID